MTLAKQEAPQLVIRYLSVQRLQGSPRKWNQGTTLKRRKKNNVLKLQEREYLEHSRWSIRVLSLKSAYSGFKPYSTSSSSSSSISVGRGEGFIRPPIINITKFSNCIITKSEVSQPWKWGKTFLSTKISHSKCFCNGGEKTKCLKWIHKFDIDSPEIIWWYRRAPKRTVESSDLFSKCWWHQVKNGQVVWG